MNERLFARLAARLGDEAVVLASVLRTRGATPRKAGARMLVGARGSEGSVGGGLAEAQVLAAAHALLEFGDDRGSLAIDLTGGPAAAGVCGGRMELALRRWQGPRDQARAQAIARGLARGVAVSLNGEELGEDGASERLQPDPRLLIVGAGHCGQALCELALPLDFDVWVFDADADRIQAGAFAGATVIAGEDARLAEALATPRTVHAVLLNRDFQADVATLRALAPAPPRFLGMMGSRRRIAQVRAAVPDFDRDFAHLRAPVGLDIGAQTPHEIAVSILAQLIADRREARP